MKRVLVIDDDPGIRRLLNLSLGKKDYEVFEAADGFSGLQAVQGIRPDIILLDLNLPDRDGKNVLAELRGWSTIPVIVLSARNTESDIVELLNTGADDYVIKPFNTGELLARMGVALRRNRPETAQISYQYHDLTVDFDKREVRVRNQPVKLTPTEYSLLALLALHPGRIVTHDHILRELWGPVSAMEGGNLRVHVAAIRRKIEPESSLPQYLLTEPGIGYRLRSE